MFGTIFILPEDVTGQRLVSLASPRLTLLLPERVYIYSIYFNLHILLPSLKRLLHLSFNTHTTMFP